MDPHNNPGVEKRFIISLALTSTILFAEIAGGIWTGSLALLSDAAHVFMDIFALALSFLALKLSARPADDRHTYGFHRLEVLAALLNGVSLGVIAVGIWYEAYHRWLEPGPIRSQEMLLIAALGLAVNVVVAFVLGGHDQANEPDHGHGHSHQHARDLNVHSAFLHVLGDAISSVGVIIAAIVIWRTGWSWVDPLISVLIGALIVVSAVRVLRSSLHILIEGVPEGMDINEVGERMRTAPDVTDVHDLHVWNICSGHVALSAHVVLCGQSANSPAQVMSELKHRLSHEFGIEHTTIQFEETPCSQR